MSKALTTSTTLRMRIFQLEGILKALEMIAGCDQSALPTAQVAIETANKDLGRILDQLVDEEWVKDGD